jgi:cytokinesis protein
MIYISKDALALVFPALDNLSRSNEDKNDPTERNIPGYYDYWFKSLEIALLGRGKMGSLVGASEEVRKGSGHDSSLQEYAVSSLY